jgi:hypothetical protein
MAIKILVLLLLVAFAQSARVRRGWAEYKSFKAYFELSSTRLHVSLRMPWDYAKHSFAMLFQTEKEKICPSLGYTFNKGYQEKFALSMAGACENGGNAPYIRWDLTGDWIRTRDEIKEGIWYFEGTRENFDVNLEIFGILETKYLRVQTVDFADFKPTSSMEIVPITWE